MGKSKSNYAITGLSGKVGKVFVFRQRGGETIVATLLHTPKLPVPLRKHNKRDLYALRHMPKTLCKTLR